MKVFPWKKQRTVAQLNEMCLDTIHDVLHIRFTEVGEDFLEARMVVDFRTKQPFGFLHGGASVVLAESLGSMASYLAIEEDGEDGKGGVGLGIEVNANHVKAVRDGIVTGRASPVHLGRSLHVWQITISDEQGATVCVSRLTVMIRASKSRPA